MEPTLAEIRMFGGNFAPRGWALCEGQLLPINQNQSLYSIIGTIYGGDGRTSFALPDFRGRINIGPGHGAGLSSHSQGAKGGTETNTMSLANMPSHNHVGSFTGAPHLPVGDNVDGGDDPSDQYLGTPGTDIYNSAASAGETLGPLDNSLSVSVANTGANTPYNNMQPFLALNFIICLQGLFPSRN
jgi:microcystin-dependent protein